MPGTQPVSKPVAAILPAIIAIITSGDWNPRIFADLFSIPMRSLMQNLFTTDTLVLQGNTYLGQVFLVFALLSLIYKRLGNVSVAMAMVMTQALSSDIVLDAMMVQQGIYIGRIVKGDKSVAEMLTAYLGLHLRTFGLSRSSALVKAMFEDLMHDAHRNLSSWVSQTSEVLKAPSQPNEYAKLDAPMNAVEALYTTNPPTERPDLRSDAENTPVAHRAPLFSVGIHALHVTVAHTVVSIWPGMPMHVMQGVITASMSRYIAGALPRYLQVITDAEVSDWDPELVYLWFASRALEGEWDAMRNFVQVIMFPALLAVRQSLFSLYLPGPPFLRFIGTKSARVPSAMQHLLLYAVANFVLGHYHSPARPRRLELLASDSNLIQLLKPGVNEQIWTTEAIDGFDEAQQTLSAPARDTWSGEDLICIIADGFLVPESPNEYVQETILDAAVKGFVAKRLPADLKARPYRLGASNLKLNGSAILLARRSDIQHLFPGQSDSDLRMHDGRQIKVSIKQFVYGDDATEQLLETVRRIVSHDVLEKRSLQPYRDYLLPPRSSPRALQPLAHDAVITFDIFGQTVTIYRKPGERVGYILDGEYPDVSRFSVQFCGQSFLGQNLGDTLTDDLRRSLHLTEKRLWHDDEWLQVLYSAEVSDDFIVNLNKAVPRLNSVDGIWCRMDAQSAQKWANELMDSKAREIEFALPPSNSCIAS